MKVMPDPNITRLYLQPEGTFVINCLNKIDGKKRNDSNYFIKNEHNQDFMTAVMGMECPSMG